jgi:hypothetical protein
MHCSTYVFQSNLPADIAISLPSPPLIPSPRLMNPLFHRIPIPIPIPIFPSNLISSPPISPPKHRRSAAQTLPASPLSPSLFPPSPARWAEPRYANPASLAPTPTPHSTTAQPTA